MELDPALSGPPSRAGSAGGYKRELVSVPFTPQTVVIRYAHADRNRDRWRGDDADLHLVAARNDAPGRVGPGVGSAGAQLDLERPVHALVEVQLAVKVLDLEGDGDPDLAAAPGEGRHPVDGRGGDVVEADGAVVHVGAGESLQIGHEVVDLGIRQAELAVDLLGGDVVS